MMYTKILVPLDGSKLGEQVLPYVQVFARNLSNPGGVVARQRSGRRVPFWPPLTTDEYLEQAAAKYFSPVTHTDHVQEVGKPAEVIVDRARDDPACLIAMATHGLSGARRWLLGSVASRVARTTANPLLFIRPLDTQEPSTAIELKTLFVPLDGSGVGGKSPASCDCARQKDQAGGAARARLFVAAGCLRRRRPRLHAGSWPTKGDDSKGSTSLSGGQSRRASS